MLRLTCLYSIFFIHVLPLLGQVNFQSSDLPILRFETLGQTIFDEPKIMVQMYLIDNGSGQRNEITDTPNNYNGWAGIEFRGASSQAFFDKKSIAIETRKEDGSNNNVSLLGMPKENDWVLYAPFSDKSLIRNALAYHWSGQIMEYAPRGRFCEVMINDDYYGVYLLLEKIKRDDDRVAIAKMDQEDSDGNALTGGYIIKLDKFSGSSSEGWSSDFRPRANSSQEIFYQYHYPKADEISVTQKEYIQNYMRDFELLMSKDPPLFNDSLEGYHRFIDPATFVDYILVNELSKNVDAYRLSTYLYKDNIDSDDSRLKAGPVWDFNLGFGNVNFCAGPEPTGWVLNYNNICPDDFWLIPFWWNKLLRDPKFTTSLQTRWKALRSTIWTKDNIYQVIDSLTQVLSESQRRNFERWPILGVEIWPNSFVGTTYGSEISHLKEWLMQRIDWMDKAIEELYFYEPVRTGAEHLVYPNPFHDAAKLEFEGETNFYYELFIYNAIGQLVKHRFIKPQPQRRYSIKLPEFQDSGLYFYSVIDGNNVHVGGTFLKW